MDLAALSREEVARRGRNLEILTIAWNSLEGLIALALGALAGSISLRGFGFDSLIEVASGAVLFLRISADADPAKRERMELLSLRIVGVCFLVLATYITYEALINFWRHVVPRRSAVGIALACASMIVMPFLSRAKRDVGKALNSAAMAADAKQSELCAYLSAILLGGLLLNSILGWWWADPVAALVMAPIIANEGREALSGKSCSDCH